MSKLWTPHEYQTFTQKFAEERVYAGLLLDPGLGKTSISLNIINTFKKKTLIIAPLRVAHLVWPSEIMKWLNFNNIKYTVLHGPDKEKQFLRNDVGVYIINPEGMEWLHTMMHKHRRFPWEVLFVDESTKFKSPKSKRFKILKPMLKMFKRRYILTGSLTSSGLLDVWAQIYILDMGRALGDSFYKYRNKYFYQADYQGFKWEPHPWALAEIRKAIEPFCIHLSASDHLDLPEFVENDIYVELPEKIMKQYKQMEDKLFSELSYDEESFKVVASSAGVAYGKCRQIIQGFLFEHLDELEKAKGTKPKAHHIHHEKLDVLEDFVESLNGSPALVAFHYKPDLENLKSRFPDMPYIGSGVTIDQTKIIEADWNKGKYALLGGHPMSMGHGLNLQESGHNVIWYTMTDSWELYDQFNRRVYRQGFKGSRVIVTRIIVKNTIDEASVINLQNRGKTQSDMLSALKKYRSAA